MLKSLIKSYYTGFIDLLFHKVCVSCKKSLASSEYQVCSLCLSQLPYTNFWMYKHNPVSEVFYGRVQVEHACSLVFFEKGSVFQRLLHSLKYQNNPVLGVILGKILGAKLLKSEYDQVDFLLPVPLHKSRQSKRGYNQSEKIASGIGHVMDKQVLSKSVIRLKSTKTQTFKSRYERWQNVEGVFKITDPDVIADKHILVVDDVITTGATSEALIAELLKIPGTKVSFVALASA